MFKSNIHNVTKVTLGEPEQLHIGTWTRRLYIYMEDSRNPVSITLFADTQELLDIKTSEQEEC